MEQWYIKNPEGKVFGPIDFETLKAWVREGRVEPLAGISSDLENWMLAPLKSELEMNWVIENDPGHFYGPTHRAVVDDLVKTGSVKQAARFYQDDRGAAVEKQNALQAALAEKDKELSSREAALAEARKQIAKRDLSINSTQMALTQRDERIAEVMASLAQKDSQIETLTKNLKLKEGELVQRQADLERKISEMDEQTSKLHAREHEIEDLQQQLAARDAVHEREWKTSVEQPQVVANEMPPPVARQAFGFRLAKFLGKSSTTTSLIDLERRAQEELSRLNGGSSPYQG